jgi:hypothetical protein
MLHQNQIVVLVVVAVVVDAEAVEVSTVEDVVVVVVVEVAVVVSETVVDGEVVVVVVEEAPTAEVLVTLPERSRHLLKQLLQWAVSCRTFDRFFSGSSFLIKLVWVRSRWLCGLWALLTSLLHSSCGLLRYNLWALTLHSGRLTCWLVAVPLKALQDTLRSETLFDA